MPHRKLRLGLLERDMGFLGTGAYREHFFGEVGTLELMEHFVKEKARYTGVRLDCGHMTLLPRS